MDYASSSSCSRKDYTVNLKKIILDIVNNSSGIKNVELALKVLHDTLPVQYDALEFMTILDGLVALGEIVEIEYTLPGYSNRIKSIYFPKGTNILRDEESE